jgi:eukaryotic-like serine/threonine-protein kinase
MTSVKPERLAQIEELFHRALGCESEERFRLLEEAGSADPGLRREVELLLSSYEGASTHLRDVVDRNAPTTGESGATASVARAMYVAGVRPETAIGRYHLLQLIGEGGMGEVWLAEQKEPVRRRVAVKLLKAGLNPREVIARFESERQALAIMDHPAIAKVFDAGSTPEGAQYFVMEYVAGVPITTYCDNHRLSTPERLELFMRVCEGVQHAHQKAIIHRDLKPSNILVIEVDGHAAPKIIDFGVAKALAQKLTAATLFTRVGAMIGTPEYMSPEQALSSGEDIDTRSDVYSLGIILYELLAGAPPLDLRKITLDEFLRRLREEEPAKPSAKIRTQDAATSTDLAHKRHTEPVALGRQMRGDLDAIAMKALEKDRSRRYGSPAELLADIGRYLKNEAVLAAAPSAAYRARKFARRHRGALLTTAAFVLVLMMAAGISIWQSIRANREAAVAQAVNKFLQNDLLAQASAATQSGARIKPDPDLKVRTALDRAAARIAGKFDRQPDVEAAIRETIGQTYIDLGLYPQARVQLERAFELQRRTLGAANPKSLKTISRLGHTAWLEGKYQDAEKLFGEALGIQRRVLGSEHADTLDSMHSLGIVYYLQGKFAQAEALDSQTIEIQRRVLGPEHPNTLASMNNLANVDNGEGKYAQAEALYGQVFGIRQRVLGLEHPYTLLSMSNLANSYGAQGKYAQAEALCRQTLEIRRRVLGPEHPETLISMNNLADLYDVQGKYAAAEVLFSKTLEISRRVLGPEHPLTLAFLAGFTSMNQRQGKYALAETHATQALAGRRRALGSEHPDTILSAADLALAYVSEGKFAESEPLAREAFDFALKKQPEDWHRFRAESLLGASLAGQKKYADAEPLLLEGYQGMMARKERIAVPDRCHLDRAHKWIIQLYQAWGKQEKLAEWKKK